MTRTLESWRDEVREATIAGDREALRRLFEVAGQMFGEDAGSQWAAAMSALDASAQTG
jgi:hypothetical protein